MTSGRAKIMRSLTIAVFIAAVASISPAFAQDPSAPLPNILPPPPPPPPPPSMAIPKIPKMDEIPTSQLAPAARRKSFDKEVQDCIHEGAAAGLGPNERAAYTRACVNSR